MNIKQIPSLLRILYFRIRYHGSVSIDIHQNIEKNVEICMENGGKINVGYSGNIRRQTSLHAFGGSIIIGDHFFANRNVSITSMELIEIGNYVQIGNNVVIVDHNHNYKKGNNYFTHKSITIGDNVWIGANSVVLQGTHIGNNCVIAAGSIVLEDIPNNTVFYQKRNNEFKTITR